MLDPCVQAHSLCHACPTTVTFLIFRTVSMANTFVYIELAMSMSILVLVMLSHFSQILRLKTLTDVVSKVEWGKGRIGQDYMMA